MDRSPHAGLTSAALPAWLVVLQAVACGGSVGSSTDRTSPALDGGTAGEMPADGATGESDAGEGPVEAGLLPGAIDAGADASSSSDAATSPDGDAGSAVIVNSGSTNAAGFRVVVTADGQASWQDGAGRNMVNALDCSSAEGTTTLTATLTSKLFADLGTPGALAGFQFNSCAKSVSFGTTTSVAYGGATVPDVECGSSADARAQAVSDDVTAIEQAIAAVCR